MVTVSALAERTLNHRVHRVSQLDLSFNPPSGPVGTQVTITVTTKGGKATSDHKFTVQ
ncbi:MAG TPA: hypothetical protein VMI10_04660 [Terriglobales bacterium]|nr:hypothetical protein [Terriglobales bacterium]